MKYERPESVLGCWTRKCLRHSCRKCSGWKELLGETVPERSPLLYSKNSEGVNYLKDFDPESSQCQARHEEQRERYQHEKSAFSHVSDISQREEKREEKTSEATKLLFLSFFPKGLEVFYSEKNDLERNSIAWSFCQTLDTRILCLEDVPSNYLAAKASTTLG